jgi:hypothetical protein
VTIGANSTLELNRTGSGAITFAGANATRKIDGATMPTAGNHLSHETVRKQLKSVLAKTGTRRHRA